MERDNRPRNKEAAFNAGSQGENGVPRKLPEMTEEQKRAFGIEVGRLQIKNLGVVQSMSHDKDEIAKTEYYKFHILMTLRGVDPQEMINELHSGLKRTPKELQAHIDTLNWGAKQAAYEYLYDYSDNETAQTIL